MKTRSLIVMTRVDAMPDGATHPPLLALLAPLNARLLPLFPMSPTRQARHALARAKSAAPDLSVFHTVDAPDTDLDALAAKRRDQPYIDAAYIKPMAELPVLNVMTALATAPPLTTPDFGPQQLYLGRAPAGIDARFAAAQRGGTGVGVRIIDCEGAWRFTHEDLTHTSLAGGVPTTDLGFRNHGTAVFGEIAGDDNGRGVTGISPDANLRGYSSFDATGGQYTQVATLRAADLLGPGDLILIEGHRPGPRFNFTLRPDQKGYIPIEWWPDDFAAIQSAVSRGVIVIEAGGNGAEDLDDALYDTPAPGFPAGWTNPFRRAPSDSGAIIVGAGAPPPGTHGADWGPDRSRLDFSNHGSAVDAQAWGREVTTTGYGDLQGGTSADEDHYYTNSFAGSSSASPMVTAALACVQGVLRARGLPLLTPARARDLLRTTGSPQTDGPGMPATQRIGNRPDLRQLLRAARAKPRRSGVARSATKKKTATTKKKKHR